jgi:hypothetical protein
MLRRYFWQLLGTILALLAILATYDVFFRGRPSKNLQVVLQAPASLVTIRPEATADIEVLYKGQKVGSASVLQARIENSGNQPILDSDYTRPVTFSFSPEHEIADVAIANSDPPNVGMQVTKTSKSQAEASRTLLNPQDSVTVRFITISASNKAVLDGFSVDGRIVGVRGLKVGMPTQESPGGKGWRFPDALLLLGGGIASIVANILGDLLTRWRRRRRPLPESQA